MNQFSGRKFIIGMIFVLVGAIYLGRLFYIQVVDDSYKLDAKNQAFRYETEFPVRGYIYDRNGKLLVFNDAAYDLVVIPRNVKDIDTLALCRLLGITKESFDRRMNKAIMPPNSPRKPSIFEKQISAQQYAALQEKLYKYPGFYVQPRTLRKYPKKIAAHLLGYIGEVDRRITEKYPYYSDGDYIGISGIEKSYEKVLRGVKGTRIVMVDVHNRPKGSYMNGIYDTAAIPGKSLTSTLDADLQAYGERLMLNKIGSVVAIEPSTGEILALITSPTYDPNLLVGRVRSENYTKLLRDTLEVPLFNRALMASYPPGSTFKLVMSLVGQQEGVLTPATHYYCDGGFHLGGLTVKCDAQHGSIDLMHAIQHSCNTYFCDLFRTVIDNRKYHTTVEGFEKWRAYALSFGIGKKLDTDLTLELRGNLPTVKYYDRYHGRGNWKSSTIISLAIGQGELGITPLQNANVVATIANRGFYYIPHIIKAIDNDPNAEELKRFKVKNYTMVTEPAYYNTVIQGMSEVVEAGTAAASKIPGIDYCAKTGTAQNPHGKDHSVFVAFAPRDNPKIAIAVLVENAGWGSDWAAPIASLIIEKYLKGYITRPEVEKRILDGNLIPNKYLTTK